MSCRKPVIDFPKKFPRCWSSKRFLQRYWKAWYRQRSRDADFLRKRAENSLKWNSIRKNRRKSLKSHRKWRGTHREECRVDSRLHYRRNRKRCFYCGKRSRLAGWRGRDFLKSIERNFLRTDGTLEKRRVLVCRNCR